jgi:hypothetical protein
MIRIVAGLASVAWLAFMAWGAMRELKATQTERGDPRGVRGMLLGQLNEWIARRPRNALKPRE